MRDHVRQGRPFSSRLSCPCVEAPAKQENAGRESVLIPSDTVLVPVTWLLPPCIVADDAEPMPADAS